MLATMKSASASVAINRRRSAAGSTDGSACRGRSVVFVSPRARAMMRQFIPRGFLSVGDSVLGRERRPHPAAAGICGESSAAQRVLYRCIIMQSRFEEFLLDGLADRRYIGRETVIFVSDVSRRFAATTPTGAAPSNAAWPG